MKGAPLPGRPGRHARGGHPLRRDAEDTLKRLHDLLGVGVGESDRLLAQRASGIRLGGRRLLGGLPGRQVGLLQLGLDEPGAHLDLGLALRLLGPKLSLALPGELVDAHDADDPASVDLGEPARLQDAVEGLLPGDVAEGQGDPALDVRAHDDVLAALGVKDAQHVDDVSVLEVERERAVPTGELARGRRGGHLGDLGRRLHPAASGAPLAARTGVGAHSPTAVRSDTIERMLLIGSSLSRA